MPDLASQLLAPWQNFYVIVGSSGAALIGIQFVVIALIADRRRHATTAASVGTFATPTVVHLGGALVVSALMSAPWSSILGASIGLVLCGLGGFGYSAAVTHSARRQTDYKPVGEDWLWHAMLPCACYAALVAAALLLHAAARTALFIGGAAALGLLLIGIHNAWDTVTYVLVADAVRDAAKTDAKKES